MSTARVRMCSLACFGGAGERSASAEGEREPTVGKLGEGAFPSLPIHQHWPPAHSITSWTSFPMPLPANKVGKASLGHCVGPEA